MNIPKTIVQTWISKDKLTPVMKAATQTWKDKNPTWDYKFFSDEDCLEFIENNFPKDTVNAYNKIKPGAGKADLFRYCYLLVKGGVYTDIDNVCIKPLDNWLTDVDKFVGILDLPCLTKNDGRFYGKHYSIYNALIASGQGHPFMWHAYKLSVLNILNQSRPVPRSEFLPQSFHPLTKVTGPKLLADAIAMALNNPFNKHFKIKEECTPCGYRFPAKLVMEKEKFHNKFHKATIRDFNNDVLVQVKYEGYNPDNYWTDITGKDFLYN